MRLAVHLSRGVLAAIIAFDLCTLFFARPHGWSTALLAAGTVWDVAVLVFASRFCRWLVNRPKRRRAGSVSLVARNVRDDIDWVKRRHGGTKSTLSLGALPSGGFLAALPSGGFLGALPSGGFILGPDGTVTQTDLPQEYTAVKDFEAQVLFLEIMRDCRGQHHVTFRSDGPTLTDVCEHCGCTFLESLADLVARDMATVTCEPTGSIQITHSPRGGR